MLLDIHPGPEGSEVRGPPRLLATGRGVFFIADDGVHGAELWRTDGTTQGAVLAADIRPGRNGSDPVSLTWVPGREAVLFVASDGRHGREPWVSDGTPLGTRLVEDVRPGAESGVRDDRQWAVAGDRVYFVGWDARAGEELWALPLTGLDHSVGENR